jgi:hypothetical protein
MQLLAPVTIAGAVTAQLSQVVDMGGKTPKQIAALAKFLYGSGGTTAKAWLQTSFDGVTWFDVFSFAFTTAAANKLSSTSPTATAQTPALTDGTLADNTNIVGLIGRYWRVKYTTTGTYAGLTSLEVDLFGSY